MLYTQVNQTNFISSVCQVVSKKASSENSPPVNSYSGVTTAESAQYQAAN